MKDLYLALARVAGLSLMQPEQYMVAAKLQARFFYSLTPFEDPTAR